jgi:signal peptidase I
LSTEPQSTTATVREYVETMAGALLLAVFVMVFIARAFTVDGPSMLPTLHSGERLLVDKVTYRFRPPQRGDVIVFRFPGDPRQYFIKRVIGLPGETIHIKDGVVLVNGRVLQEEYTASPILGQYGPYLVPSNHYFVLGDNRNNSEDSRSERVGFVDRRLVVGRALWRYWPLTRLGALGAKLAHASP